MVEVVLTTLAAHGWTIYRVDGLHATTGVTAAQILEHCEEVSEAMVRVRHPDYGQARVLFSWQEPVDTFDYGEVSIADYSTKLEYLIEEVYAT